MVENGELRPCATWETQSSWAMIQQYYYSHLVMGCQDTVLAASLSQPDMALSKMRYLDKRNGKCSPPFSLQGEFPLPT
eukprot:1160891-Pelagomonas_calceolata.AAC.1